MSCPRHFSPNPAATSIADACLPSCPYEFIGGKEYLTNWYLQTITATLLLPVCLFLLIPYLFVRRSWRYGLEATLFFLLFLFCLRFCLPLFAFGKDYRKLVCHSSIQVASKEDSWCGFSFFLGYFVAMTGSWFWLSFCLRICVTVNRLFKINQMYWYLVTLVFSITYSLISIGIVYAKNLVEGDANIMSCFISSSIDGGWYIDRLWFIPTLSIMSIGFLAMIITIFRIATVLPEGTFLKFLRHEWRYIAFVLFYMYAILSFIIYRFSLRPKQDHIAESIGEWYLCFATTNGTDCGSPDIPPYGVTTWVAYNLILAAVQFCLIFLIGNADVFNWWLWALQIKDKLEISEPTSGMSAETSTNPVNSLHEAVQNETSTSSY